MWIHSDGSIAYFADFSPIAFGTGGSGMLCQSVCGYLRHDGLLNEVRKSPEDYNFLCELPRGSRGLAGTQSTSHTLLLTNSSQRWETNQHFLQCPHRHVTHTLLACDVNSRCWGAANGNDISCTADQTPLPPLFTCVNDVVHVAYTLVCDHRHDCRDHSDEDFCVYRACDGGTHFQCRNKACVLNYLRCNHIPDCSDQSDELTLCPTSISGVKEYETPSPAVVNFDGRGAVTVETINWTTSKGQPICPETHVQCADDGYCLPVFVWCNTIHDCPQHEDEEHCDRYTCPGFYRCRASSVCLHPHHMCDGMYQCPQRDDELLCDGTCPEQCTCYGQAFFCGSIVSPSSYPDLRFLDASDSGLQYADVSNNTLLIYLRLARCDLMNLTLLHIPNLHSLDLRENHLTSITDQHLKLLPYLQHLTLSDNPLTTFIHYTLELPYLHDHLQSLDVSKVIMKELNISLLSIFPNLFTLNLTDCGMDRVVSEGNQSLLHLRVLDARGCSMTYFPGSVFQGLDQLQTVYADNYKLCCQHILPKDFKPRQCHAPSDDISSCKALLRSDVYRVLIVIYIISTVCGNIGLLTIQFLVKSQTCVKGFRVCIVSLCLSHIFMGSYLAIIGVADYIYQGTYLWNDITWKQSTTCQTAGFLSLLSSEVSAFIICLITLDRLLVLRFPFSQLHFHRTSAVVTCAGIWTAGLIVAAIPLLPTTSHWQFYSQTAVCMPLPFNAEEFADQPWVFHMVIVPNFIIFMLVALGQVFIYKLIPKNQLFESDRDARARAEHSAARHQMTIAVSDFLCWFTVGSLGLLASSGHAVASEVNVAMAISVLPLNSAINPFLYMLSMRMEHNRLQSLQRLKQFVLKQTQSKNVDRIALADKCTEEEVKEIFCHWVSQGTLSSEHVSRFTFAKK